MNVGGNTECNMQRILFYDFFFIQQIFIQAKGEEGLKYSHHSAWYIVSSNNFTRVKMHLP